MISSSGGGGGLEHCVLKFPLYLLGDHLINLQPGLEMTPQLSHQPDFAPRPQLQPHQHFKNWGQTSTFNKHTTTLSLKHNSDQFCPQLLKLLVITIQSGNLGIESKTGEGGKLRKIP